MKTRCRTLYKIKCLNHFWLNRLLAEIARREVRREKFKIFDDETIITHDKNIVDIATETFIKLPNSIEIQKINTIYPKENT